MGMKRRRLRLGPLALAAVLAGSADAAAQDLEPFIARCAAGGSSSLLTACQNAVLAAQALRGGIAVTDAVGDALPGSSSTIGRRLGASPRVSVALRLNLALFDVPDVLDSGPLSLGESSVEAFGVRGTVAVGVLDGFSLLPTVGGILSFDLVGSASLLFLQDGDGFSDNVSLLSIGGRLGLLRESFTMPGVTVSLVQQYGERFTWGGITDSGTRVDADVSTTALRAAIGKDLFTMAFLAGVGWDWQKGELAVRVKDPERPGAQGVADADDLTTRRTVYYGGVSMTRLVFQFSVEAGWASGYDDLPGYPGDYDPGGITPFVNLALRLTL